ncbi:NUDIX hydrolase [Variovorax saccharolyticus]|uniref:NUDIX hydrolase n=1 Tax=Variovorax saccharolyticus TaxID=3053516 RepID=UPI002574F8CD|nr:NUDIX hydrolase [Variovorax sp. J31P216]MDM0027078.1 NUDIX hydrolase [Variovorax sp. J31P216]
MSIDRPIAAIISVVIRNREVLLVRRANRPDAGRWGFPGGKMEFGESIRTAAMRELFEETQVRAEVHQTYTAIDAFDRDDDGTLRQHFVLVGVACRWLSGEPRAGDDALEARWFPLKGLVSADSAMCSGVAEMARQAAILVIA